MKVINSNLKLIAWVWQGSKIWVVFNLLDIIINPLRNLIIDVLLIGFIFNSIQSNRTFIELKIFFIILIIFYTLNVIFEALLAGIINPIEIVKIKKHIDENLFDKASKVPLSMYDNTEFYERFIFSIDNCCDVACKTVTNFANFIAYVLGGILSIGLITGIEPVMVVFIMFSIIMSLLISKHKEKISFDFSEKRIKIQTKEKYIHDMFYLKDYAKELRTFTKLSDLVLDIFSKTEKENEILTKKYGRKIFVCSMIDLFNSRIIMYWGIMIITIGLIYIKGNIEPGNLLIMTTSIATASLLINAIVRTVPEMVSNMRFYNKFQDFLQIEYESNDFIRGGIIKIYKIEVIIFDRICFTYPGESTPILSNISFEVKQNEVMVIAGANGAGKSTILKLLMKLYKPDSGNILINGVNIDEIDRSSYLNALACAFQEVSPYAVSLCDNIKMSQEKANWIGLKMILDKIGLKNELDSDQALKMELTKEFSEDGVVLSEGNLQKLAIARALYRDSSALLLDEITSAVDPEGEMKIINSIYEMKRNKIIVMVSHKLSCVKNADKIIFIENGKIVEHGNHQELINKKGNYYRLFLNQSKKFEDAESKRKLEKEDWA